MIKKLLHLLFSVSLAASAANSPCLPSSGCTGISNANANTLTLGGIVDITGAFSGLPVDQNGSYSNPSWITSLIASKLTGQVSGAQGGSGVDNTGKTITLGGNFVTFGAHNLTLTLTGDTNLTLPTSGTVATTGGSLPSIQGTANEVLVNGTSGSPVTGSAITLTTPQFIGTTNTPTFQALSLVGTGSGLNFQNNSAISGQTIAPINWLGLDSISGSVFYGRIRNEIVSNATGVPTSKTILSVQNGSGSLTDYMSLDGSTETINLLKTPNISTLTASQLVATDASKNLNSVNLSGDVSTSGLTTSIGAAKVTNAMLAGGIDLTAKVSGILPGANGGSNNGFMQFSGPASSLKTYTLPNASTTILTTNAAVTEAQGGTNQASYALGDTLYSSATNALSKLAGNTTTTRKFLRQTGNGTISAAPAWDTLTAADISGSALTKTDDTNVTLTLGGSPTTALLNAASLTLGWTGQLSLSRGGLGISSGTSGGIPYFSSSSTVASSAVLSANQVVVGNGAGAAPSSTATLPTAVQSNIIQLGTLGSIAIGSGALSGTAAAMTFNTALSDGDFINFGGTGQNIGLKDDGTLFSASNLNWNATTNLYKYASNNASSVIEENLGNIYLNTATNGTSGNTATPVTAMQINSNARVLLPQLTASTLLSLDGSNQVSSVSSINNAVLQTNGSGVPSLSTTLPTAVQSNITNLGTIGTVYNNTVQPRFFARYTSNATNVTGNAVEYTLIFDSASTNVGSMYDTSTGIITIPNTGFYRIGGTVYLNGLGASNTDVICKLYTTGLNVIPVSTSASARNSNGTFTCSFNIAKQFTAGNTIYATVEVDGGTQVIGVKGTAPQVSYFYGSMED